MPHSICRRVVPVGCSDNRLHAHYAKTHPHIHHVRIFGGPLWLAIPVVRCFYSILLRSARLAKPDEITLDVHLDCKQFEFLGLYSTDESVDVGIKWCIADRAKQYALKRNLGIPYVAQVIDNDGNLMPEPATPLRMRRVLMIVIKNICSRPRPTSAPSRHTSPAQRQRSLAEV